MHNRSSIVYFQYYVLLLSNPNIKKTTSWFGARNTKNFRAKQNYTTFAKNRHMTRKGGHYH